MPVKEERKRVIQSNAGGHLPKRVTEGTILGMIPYETHRRATSPFTKEEKRQLRDVQEEDQAYRRERMLNNPARQSMGLPRLKDDEDIKAAGRVFRESSKGRLK